MEDKEIVIGNVATPTDATAHGGGWKLKGANNKTITYNQTGDKWESNKNFEAPNLAYTSGDQTFAGNLTIDTGTAATIDWGDIDGNAHGRLYADSTGTFIGSKTFQKLSLRTNNTERLNINADGNNTSLISPNWNIFEIRTGGSHDAIIKLTDGDNGVSSVKGEIRWDHSDQKLEIGAGDNTNHLTINSGGDVAINAGLGVGAAAAPGSTQLEVVGAIGGIRSKVTTNNGGYLLYQGLSSTDASVFTVTHNGRVTGADGVYDSNGNLRSVPQNTQGSAYDLVASDNGKHIFAGGNVTIPPNIFSAGDIITVVNNTAGDINIVAGAGQGIYNSATASTAVPKTLAQRGMATILITNSSTCYVSGTSLTDP